MNDYRREVKTVAKDARWTFWQFLPLFIVVIIVLFVLGFALHSMGIIGHTAVERKVFEQSYQRNAAQKSALATFSAQLVEINGQLDNPNLDDNTRYNLNAQKSRLNVQINILKGEI